MRLWSLDPARLDRVALVSGWREGLLAQAVLLGRTKGYTRHPQLERFRALVDPVTGVATWLAGLADEADRRRYRFDRSRMVHGGDSALRMEVTEGQLDFEWRHLMVKSNRRSPQWADDIRALGPAPHPLFDVVPGPVAVWERG